MSEVPMIKQAEAVRVTHDQIEVNRPEPSSFSSIMDQMEKEAESTGKSYFIKVGEKTGSQDNRMFLLRATTLKSTPAYTTMFSLTDPETESKKDSEGNRMSGLERTKAVKHESSDYLTYYLMTPDGPRSFILKKDQGNEVDIMDVFEYYSDRNKLRLDKGIQNEWIRYEQAFGEQPRQISISLHTPSMDIIDKVIEYSKQIAKPPPFTKEYTTEDVTLPVAEAAAAPLITDGLKKTLPQRARQLFGLFLKKFPTKQLSLTGAAFSYLISSGCGNVEKQPTGMPSEVEFQRLTTPTPEPTPPPSPTPTLEPTPTSTPNPTETPTTAPPTTYENKEVEQRNHVLVVDITKDTFPNLEKYGLPNMSEEELKEKLGIKGDLTMQELMKKVPEDEKLQLAVLAHITKLHYGDHGREVVRAMEEVDRFSGIKGSNPDLVSLPDLIEDIKVERDKIGNPTFWIELGNDELIKTISKSPQKFVNLSLELGKVGIKFEIFRTEPANPDATQLLDTLKLVKVEVVRNEEGAFEARNTYQLSDGTQIDQKEVDRLIDEANKKIVVPRQYVGYKPIDAYGSRGDPLESLGKMANVASKFPDKIFFAAAGNPIKYDEDIWPDRPKITDQREMLIQQGKWPPNLFMIGFWGIEYEGNKYASGYGADYYINVEDLDRLNLSWASSFATPAAERAVQNYFSREGIEPTPDLVRQVLDKYSVPQKGETLWNPRIEKEYSEIYKVIDIKRLFPSSGPEAAARTLDPQLLQTK